MPFKPDSYFQRPASNTSSPALSAFSCEFPEMSNFLLNNEEEKFCEIKDGLENKRYVQMTKKSSDMTANERKSLFFGNKEKDEETNKNEHDHDSEVNISFELKEKSQKIVIYEGKKLN